MIPLAIRTRKGFKPFIHNAEKSCSANTARFLKYVWLFFNIMHEKMYLKNKFSKHSHSVHWVSTSPTPQKHHPLFFPLNLQTAQAPLPI